MSESLWQLGSKPVDCSVPRVVKILNATPDSFFTDSRVVESGESLQGWLQHILDERPDIIDVGGQSTRPGSERVSPDEELRRVIPVIEALRKVDGRIPLTIDTFQSAVAREALAAGADGVNDISAWTMDPELLEVVAGCDCGYVLMHMQGTPLTMQQQPQYEDCVGEVGSFLKARLEELEQLGIARERVVLDPGIGFGKRLQDNLALIGDSERLAEIGRPLLYGISRKSFIGVLSNEPDAGNRLPGTLALTWDLLNRGVMLHRVHDARETRQLFDVWLGFREELATGGNQIRQGESV